MTSTERSTRPGSKQPGPLEYVVSHPYTTVSVVTLLIMGIGVVLRHDAPWYDIQVGAGSLLVKGQDFYKQIGPFTYPPFDALVAIPFTWVTKRVACAGWGLLSILSLVYLVRVSWRLAGGSPVEPHGGKPAAPLSEQIAFLLGNLIALQFALNVLSHLQTDLVIAFFATAGCAAIAAGRFARSAVLIGIAAAFKATPLLFAPYLLWRRKPVSAILLVLVAIGANLLPNLVHSPPGGGLWLTRWCRQYLKPMTSSEYLPGLWKNQLVNNQAVAGAARRWVGTNWKVELEPNSSGKGVRKNFRVTDRPDEPSPATMRAVFYGMCLLVSIPALWVAWKRWRANRFPDDFSRGTGVPPVQTTLGSESRQHGRDAHATGAQSPAGAGTDQPDVLHYSPGRGEAPAGVDPRMIECGIVLLLMLLLSPNSSIAHFCVMYLPAFCIARQVVHRASKAVRVFFWLAVVCGVLSIRLRLPFTFVPEQVLLWIGVVSFATVFLMLACAAALTQKIRPPSLQAAKE